jgi:alpha-amylase
LKKYPESRYMRDRMWDTSRALQKAAAGNGSKPMMQKARESLYKAQCNCPYWHGVFGGLYLHHLRSAVFENLIKADQWITPHSKKTAGASWGRVELESGERWQLRQKKLVSFFNPHYGASLEELDFIPKSTNLMCNLQRHKEAYHDSVLKKKPDSANGDEPLSIHQILGSKESDLEKYLQYDLYRRLSFMDHMFEKPVTSQEFSECAYKERGDFVKALYKKVEWRSTKGLKKLIFERKGILEIQGRKSALRLKKSIGPVDEDALEVFYELTNESRSKLSFVMGIEFNFSIGDESARRGVNEKGIREWVFHDAWRGIQIRLTTEDEIQLIAAPVETVSESELGLERTYQELGVLAQRKFELKPGETKGHRVRLTVN